MSERNANKEEDEESTMSGRRKIDQKLKLRERRYVHEQLMKRKRSEELEVLEEVFDRSTLMILYRMLNNNVISKVFGVVKSGKESRIYRAEAPGGEELALKIFLTVSAEFRKGMLSYIEGDPRFRRVKRDTRSLIKLWAQKEFKNLYTAQECGVRVPKPRTVEGNVVVMEFIGRNGIPAPLLREVKLKNPERIYRWILKSVKKLYKKGELVHADLSEYNVMVNRGHPVLIDMSQSVSIKHPSSQLFLERDLTNITRYFERIGVDAEEVESLIEWVRGDV